MHACKHGMDDGMAGCWQHSMSPVNEDPRQAGAVKRGCVREGCRGNGTVGREACPEAVVCRSGLPLAGAAD